jgi:hypothetical protein
MANKKISDLPAHDGNLAGTEEVELNNGGVSERTTVNKLSLAARNYSAGFQGDVEIYVDDATLTVGDDTDGYTTLVHEDLIGKVNLKLIMQNGAYIQRANFTYNSSLGRIVLSNGDKFRIGCVLYIQYKAF